MERFGRAATREKWRHAVCDEGPLPKFQLLKAALSERCVKMVEREICDIILKEEDLPFRIQKESFSSFIDQARVAEDFIQERLIK